MIEGVKRVYIYLEPTELWELIKFECAQFTRKCTRVKSHWEKENKFNMYCELGKLQQEGLEKDFSKELQERIHLVEGEIRSYEIKDVQRSAFRCCMQWTEYGETPSKYYFNLEKRNFTTKTMYVVRKN